MKKIVHQKHFSILQLLEDTVDWVQFTLSTTCFTKANLGETLSSKTRTMFFPTLAVTWCKSARLLRNCVSNQCWLIDIQRQRRNSTVIFWLTLNQTRQSVTLVYKHQIHSLKAFCPRPAETFRTFGQWTHKSLYSQSVPIIIPQKQKHFPWVLPEKICRTSLRLHCKRSQKKPAKQHNDKTWQSFEIKPWLFSSEKINYRQKSGILTSENGLKLIKVITLTVMNLLSWYAAVCCRFSLLCATTSLWILGQFQSRSFQFSKLNKIQRTTLIRSERKSTKSCLPKQTL